NENTGASCLSQTRMVNPLASFWMWVFFSKEATSCAASVRRRSTSSRDKEKPTARDIVSPSELSAKLNANCTGGQHDGREGKPKALKNASSIRFNGLLLSLGILSHSPRRMTQFLLSPAITAAHAPRFDSG